MKIFRLPKKSFVNITKPQIWKWYIQKTYDWFKNTASFVLLLTVYLLASVVSRFGNSILCPAFLKNKLGPPLSKFYRKILILNRRTQHSITRISLIELALHNMKYKMSRTLITVFGMSVGIAAIVFLVSIGYGLQELVISRVARLDEMQQTDVDNQPGSKTRINDEVIADISQYPNVEHVLPVIALVGKVNYNGSISDMPVYGVTAEYLNQSAIQPVSGKNFTSDDLAIQLKDYEVTKLIGKVAGASTSAIKEPEPEIDFNEKIRDVEFAIYPTTWVKIREEPNTNAKIIGYIKKTEGLQTGEEYYGSIYDSPNEYGKAKQDLDGNWYGKWIKSKNYIWELKDDGSYKPLTEDNSEIQVQKEGYFAEVGMNVYSNSYIEQQAPKVLGVATDSTESIDESVVSTTELVQEIPQELDADSDLWVQLEGETVDAEKSNIDTVALSDKAIKEAVVNRAMLRILGLNEKEAVGKTFNVSFVVPSDILEDSTKKVQSLEDSYTIVAVIPQDDTPYFYVPFIDLRTLGIINYSQLKVVASEQKFVEDVRQRIEAQGFATSSVIDTVEQINSLFLTARTILALIGTVALAVASLGMFNTLTVSLLERTREIGLMKAMGMKSSEVRELILTESMIMGFFGGAFGILLGFAAGTLLSLLLTLLAAGKGLGYIDIAYVPPLFIIVIVALSLLVGTITGIYPAKRAKKISALNALRYE